MKIIFKTLNCLQLILATTLIFTTLSSSATGCSKWSKLDSEVACIASATQLLTAPVKYKDIQIRTTGVIHFEHERNLLYLDDFSYKNGIYENSINLVIDVEDIQPLTHLNGEAVQVYGKLRKLSDGHYYLTDISHIKSLQGKLVFFDDSTGEVKATVLETGN